MASPIQFHSENDLKNKFTSDITSFWQRGKFDSFIGVDDVNIHYAKFIQDQPLQKKSTNPSIIIVSGRCESYLKYQELTFDLYRQGYNIFILDHRGQGLSGRLLSNPHKGYVRKFQHYVDDLRYFVEKVIINDCPSKPYLLGHSMGGAISVRFMQDAPNAIKAAVIASPMIGFNSGFVPIKMAENIIAGVSALNSLISKTPWYFGGQKDYSALKFTENNLTHSKPRYKSFVDLYQKNKGIQLGGVTVHWLKESIKAQEEMFRKLPLLTTPTFLLQAGEDSIVSLQAQTIFCRELHALHPQSCPNGLPFKIEDAFHELFFEVDEIRDQAIVQTINWFEKYK